MVIKATGGRCRRARRRLHDPRTGARAGGVQGRAKHSARSGMRRGAGAIAIALALGMAGPAHALPELHAHRGGAVQNGQPAFPENTMPAFRHAAAQGFVIELDVKLTSDRVPIVIHDPTLDRTTTCAGPVRGTTAAAIRAECVVDVLGSGEVTRPAGLGETAKVPTLAELLAFARKSGARLNLEIKNVPTDADFDPTDSFVRRVVKEIAGSEMPLSNLLVQSFWPPDLEVVKHDLPGVTISLLTRASENAGAPAFATARGYQWISAAWPVDATYVREAHLLGRKIAVWTLNRRDDIQTAAGLGVDAVITDDPYTARRTLGR